MIELPCQQGSVEWHEARLGIPTASEFRRIVTPRGNRSSSRHAYRGELLAEWALGEPVGGFTGTEDTERGQVLEPDARKYYAFVRDAEPREVGFIYRDEARLVGCSPDAMVGDGLLELKCPQPGNHLLWLAMGVLPAKHFAQVQGCLWVTGAAWLDFMSYHPGLPEFLKRVEPDEKYQKALDAHIPEFIAELLAGRERLRGMGVNDEEVSAV